MAPEKPNSTNKVEDNDMETVELHRACSMVNEYPPTEIIENKSTEPPTKAPDIFSFVASKASIIFSALKDLKIEVVMFVYMFSATMRSVSSTTMIMDKVCLVHFGLPESQCADLSNDLALKTKIEQVTNNYSVGHSLLQMVPSAILGMFIGPWSDKYGRKVPVIIALLGIIADGLGSTICAAVMHSRVEYYLIPALFTGLSGGMIGVLTVLYSYASDITTFNNRTMKYAFMEVSFGLAMPLGSLVGGYLYKYSGYVTVFLVSTGGHVFGLAWVLFLLKETRGLDVEVSWMEKFRNLWSIDSVRNGFRATVKRRPNKGREQILLLILAMSISVLSFAAAGSISYLYVHHRYDWDNTTYSTVSAVFSVIGTSLMLIVVPLFKYFNIGDPTLGIIGSLSLFVKNFLTAIAKKENVYFLGCLLGLLNGLGTLAGRSRISKVTSKDDLGKVFSFLTSAESVLPIASVAVVSQVFNATLNIYPGLIFLILCALMLIPVGIFIWLYRLPAVDYEEMHSNSKSEEDIAEESPPKKS